MHEEGSLKGPTNTSLATVDYNVKTLWDGEVRNEIYFIVIFIMLKNEFL